MEVVALSGGKDSVAMALRLAEVEPNKERTYLYTPTGDELPPMREHIQRVEELIDCPIFKPEAPTLKELIREQKAIPNWRMRWCTRMIKIEPCIEYLRTLENPTLFVGLRADEPLRKGLYDEHVTNRFPLREWGWGIEEVLEYLKFWNVAIPERTDCARCYYQRLIEWQRLWSEYPAMYESAVQDEIYTSLTDLRKRFEDGWIPATRKGSTESRGGCRVCSM